MFSEVLQFFDFAVSLPRWALLAAFALFLFSGALVVFAEPPRSSVATPASLTLHSRS